MSLMIRTRFQSTPPHGERRGGRLRGGRAARRFQSTPPHGERPVEAVKVVQGVVTFQSTPPHGERHSRREAQMQHTIDVSIHAPARGATRRLFRAVLKTMFQSTPPHGERQSKFPWHQRCNHGFNPRPRTGSDPESTKQTWPELVSIHAPARGATGQSRQGRRRFSSSFNPRPRTGSDLRYGRIEWKN